MRLFIAVPLDERIKQKMVRVKDRIDVDNARVRWCTADQLHLTLKFIGEVGDDRTGLICEAMKRVADLTPTFDMEIAGTGCFPPNGTVRVIWIAGSEPSGVLCRAAQGLEEELEKLGIPREKRTFSEHFTIGRVKFDRSRGKLRESVLATTFERCRQQVKELVLYQSMLARNGAEYMPVAAANLNG